MKPRRALRTAHAQRGLATVVFVIMVPVLLGFLGLAMDLARMYERKGELQHVADAVALAAGSKLDGTPGGVIKAYTAAKHVFGFSYYDYNKNLLDYWDDQAITFASDPHAADSAWLSYTDAKLSTNAPTALYVRFDTSKLAQPDGLGKPGVIALALSTILGVQVAPEIMVSAVAGKLTTPVTPLAVCAMSTSPTGSHTNVNSVAADTLYYGFRTGVSYNLLQLNPSGVTRQAYLVDPVDSPAEKSNNRFTTTYMQPFMCAGSVALGQIVGQQVYIKPLPDDFESAGWHLVDWLNSRFGASNGACNTAGAPPDSNVREFDGITHDPAWYMATAEFKHPTGEWPIRNNNSLVGFADLVTRDTQNMAPPDPSLAEACFGPLWTYSKPKYSNGTPYSIGNWKDMYQFQYPDPSGKKDPKTGKVLMLTVQVTTPTNYPIGSTSTPYLKHVTAPAGGGGVPGRRVLNVPLLDCATNSNGVGKVLAIGQFFMTGKATPTVIPGEFAGVNNMAATAVLFR